MTGLNIIHRFRPFKLLSYPEKLALIWVNSPLSETPPGDWFSLWNRSRLRSCTDGAANNVMLFCKKNLMKSPHLIAGDFDSISSAAKEYFVEKHSTLVHVHDQNSTDLTKTLRLINKTIKDENLSINAVVLLGGLHGRFDHLFGALNAVIKHNETNRLPTFFIDGENIVTVLYEGTTHIELNAERITRVCGILPICQRETILTTSGFKWNLKNQALQFGGIVSSSNAVADEKNLEIYASSPIIFSFQLKDYTKIC